jgi:Ice-binding-like
MRSFNARLFAVLVVFGSLAACSGGGCGNCNVPGFTAGLPTPGPFVTQTPVPGASSSPLALTCAQNAISGQAVQLRTDFSWAVLASSTVTNSGPTVVTGNLGVSPGTAVTGFLVIDGGPGLVVGGSIYQGVGSPAGVAQADLTTAYNDAAGRVNPIGVGADIGGLTLPPGLYKAPVSLAVTGTVTLDGQNDPNSVFIFQIPSTLTTAVNSTVRLINLANACNVFWQVGSSATINGGSTFNGTVLSQASISVGTGAVVNGRLLARTGAVTLLSNLVTRPPGP